MRYKIGSIVLGIFLVGLFAFISLAQNSNDKKSGTDIPSDPSLEYGNLSSEPRGYSGPHPGSTEEDVSVDIQDADVKIGTNLRLASIQAQQLEIVEILKEIQDNLVAIQTEIEVTQNETRKVKLNQVSVNADLLLLTHSVQKIERILAQPTDAE